MDNDQYADNLAKFVDCFDKQNPATVYAKCVVDDMPEIYLDMWIEKDRVYVLKKLATDVHDNLVVVVAELDGTIVRPNEEVEAVLATRFKYFTAYNN